MWPWRRRPTAWYYLATLALGASFGVLAAIRWPDATGFLWAALIAIYLLCLAIHAVAGMRARRSGRPPGDE